MKQEIKTICCYCGVGCGVIVSREAGLITSVRGDPAHPANFGRLCSKGASLHLTRGDECRALYPELRLGREEERRPVTWDNALENAATRFAEIIRQHGPDAVAFYVSGQLLTEDYYVFNKLAKGLVGTNNIDTNSRLCMSSAVAGYKKTLGVDAPPCSYEDIGLAEVIFVIGANPAVAHPILFRRLEEAKVANPALKIIVADPRRTETAEIADLHLPLRPGSDIALLNAMLHVMDAEGLTDSDFIAAHTRGFADLATELARHTPQAAAEVTGLTVSDILQAARLFGRAKRALSLYCQGVNQSTHGTDNNAAIVHLHLATGKIGRPGCGPFSLTGQANAMGGREVGGLANLLSAHRDLSKAEDRDEVARLWGLPTVPGEPGRPAVDMFKALARGEVKAVWIACTNPALSLPVQGEVRRALQTAEFVVVQEAYRTAETVDYADLLLPASAWGEKSGTMTNSERRISRVRKIVEAPGEARPDWAIAAEFGRRLGRQLDRPWAETAFDYADAEAVFNEHRETTRGRDLDITGLSYARLDEEGPQQWPFPENAFRGRQRLYEDGIFPTDDGRARFVPVAHRPVFEKPGEAHPLSLLSGRLPDQWHGMTRTGSVPRLFQQEDEPLLHMHLCDMRHRGIEPGDLVRLFNGRGEIILRATQGNGLKRGILWLPMHWGSHFASHAGVNVLTPDAVDPTSSQPELKHAAVQVEKAELSYPIAVLRRCRDIGEARRLLEKARHLLTAFPYASLALYGHGNPLVILRAATVWPLVDGSLDDIDALFGLDGEEGAIRYGDAHRHIAKKAVVREGRLCGVRLAGETMAVGWLKEALAEDELDPSLPRFSLAPLATMPSVIASRKVVCQCADVAEVDIRREFGQGAELSTVQDKLKCGTFCGACLPEVRRLGHEARDGAAAIH